MLNRQAIKTRAKEIADELEKVEAAHKDGRLETKRFEGIVRRLYDESKELKSMKAAYEQANRFMAGADAAMGGGGTYTEAPDTKAFGSDTGWLFSGAEIKQLDLAMQTKTPITLEVDVCTKGIRTKSAVSEAALTNGPLPGIIQPNRFISLPYEPTRVASYLPAAGMQGPSSVWLSHTANAAEANGVAELGTKPDLGPTFTEEKVLPQKLAGQASVTMEMNQDYPEIGGWIQTELQRSLINQENNYLLNAGAEGGPSGAAFTGLLAQSGTLTRDATGTNGLDAVALAAMDLRSSSGAYSPPDLLILHPQTVTALLTTKDDQGRYLLDMLQGPGGSLTWDGGPAVRATTNPSLGGIWPQGHEGGDLKLFGVPVVQSTQIAAGVGLMLSVRGGAAVYWTRLNMLIIFDPYTGLSQNTYRWVAESRISLSCPRPGAINIISNLPVA